MQGSVLGPLLFPLLCLQAAVVAPPWADPARNPCASRPGGWQLLHWPGDGRCYRIFTRGAPCPETMELGPGATGLAECRCPPKTALSPRDARCHVLFSAGPCAHGQYFAPVPSKAMGVNKSIHRWGTCRDVDVCPSRDQLFWPRDAVCYDRLRRGPCPKGELLEGGVRGLAECKCASQGSLARHYWPPTDSCHEHFTRGPCEQKGHLFLPGRQCGCHPGLPNYHQPTGLCYQIGGLAPCPPGQQFVLANSSSLQAQCRCKEGLVLWENDGACYRLYTRGPCANGEILLNETSCAPIPCRNGRLYFPEVSACYKVGTRGPCPEGQLVLFESVRISVDGISYKGTCGCSGPEEKCVKVSVGGGAGVCDAMAGLVKWNDECFKLYTQGPCLPSEWLVPEREPRQVDEFGRRKRPKAKCECKPGFKRLRVGNSTDVGQCQSPAVVLARFLNQNLDSR